MFFKLFPMSLPHSPLETIVHPLFTKHKVNVLIKRDDLIHPIISGNKWRKLKYNIEHAKRLNRETIISFGGAFSNHIHALAYACKVHNINAIGLIRGEYHYRENFTLSWARHWGMSLNFVDRLTYKQRYEETYLAQLQSEYPNAFIVPEGGSNQFALPGMGEVIHELNVQTKFDYLLTPVGSGGTLAGLALANKGVHQLVGIAVLKQHGYLEQQVTKLLGDKANTTSNWRVIDEYHDGGYGKYSQQNAHKIKEFSQKTGVPFEPVYSGKMLIGFLNLLEQGYFKENSTVVLLHTGGLQGLGGMCERGILNKADWPVPKSAPLNKAKN